MAADGRSAVLEIKNLAVIDQPAWPKHGAPATPAVMSFRVKWTATDKPAVYEDPSKHFIFRGYLAEAGAEAEVSIPSSGFSWKSDPLEASRAAFAVIGEEANGRYYDK